MKKINIYNIYLSVAIIVLIIISSISFYFVVREVVSKKYISNENYLSMFYNSWQEENCKYDESNYGKWREIKSDDKIKKCISDIKNTYFGKREFRYKFNMIKYWVLLAVMLWLLSIHTILFLIRKK